jgi:hypothetical protein
METVKSMSNLQKSPVKVTKNVTNVYTNQNLPNDVLKQTLLYSDLKTIVNTCTANKQNVKLCDELFWRTKFEYDHLPLLKSPKTFSDWVEHYASVYDAKREVEMMIKIILTFNEFKGDADIWLWYDEGSMIHHNILKYVSLGQYDFNQITAVVFKYIIKTKLWTIEINHEEYAVHIDSRHVLNILTEELVRHNEGEKIEFKDSNVNELAYDILMQKAKQHKPIPRAYLAMYRLLKY